VGNRCGYRLEIANKLPAKIVIPMHYRDERCDFPVAGVDEFLKGKKNVQMVIPAKLNQSWEVTT